MFNASVQVDGAQPPGLLITNGEFTAFGPGTSWCPSCTQQSRQVFVQPGTVGPVRFVNSAFWGPDYGVALHSGDGLLGFSSCTFVQWGEAPHEAAGMEAITASAGSLLVTECEFQMDSTQIVLGTNVKKAVITSNIVTGTVRITNKSTAGKASIVIANNAGDS
jgi:hypothetical protein